VRDVVYIVRPGENEELRFSLRSLVHVPHGRVWIIGHRPAWVRGVEHVPTDQAPLTLATKRENAWANMRALAEHGPEEFYYCEDDYHVIRPHPHGIPPWHRGPLAEHVAEYRTRYPRSHYTRLLEHTAGYLRKGHPPVDDLSQHTVSATSTSSSTEDEVAKSFRRPCGARSFEVHAPMPVQRALLAAVLAECEANEVADGGRVLRPMWRTVYGNRHHGDAVKIRDPKVRGGWPVHAGIVSTSDATFPRMLRNLTARFPRPGPYEA